MPVRLAVAWCGAALGAYSTWLAAGAVGYAFAAEGHRDLLLFAVAGFALLAAAVFAWHSPVVPARLAAAASVAWFAMSWQHPTNRWAATFTLGLVLAHLGPAVMGHVLLATSSARHLRVLVATGYVAVAVLGLGPALFFDPVGEGCGDCPANLLLLHPEARVSEWIARAGLASLLTWTIVTVALVAVRLRHVSALRRRQSAVCAVGGAAYLAASAIGLWMNRDTGYGGYTSVERALWQLQAVALLVLAVGVATEMVRARRTRAALARLVLDLETGNRIGGVQAELARRVGDAQLRLAYQTNDGGYVDPDGTPLERPSDPARCTPLTYAGRELAVVVHRPGLLDDPVLARELVDAGHLALESEGLRARSLALLASLRASRLRLIDAGDEERRRLERDLHDGAQQRLVGLSFAMSLLARRTGPDSQRLVGALGSVQQALDELRTLGRGIFPVVLLEQGLRAALTSLTESAPLRLLEAPDHRLPRLVETTAYLLVARASAVWPVDARLSLEGGCLLICLDIDGELRQSSLGDTVDRVDALSGDLCFENSAGARTHLVARLQITPTQ
ncbi:histidine kinase [Kribbella sp. NPDC006257]|uniref:sensor histidine kinase n=1 Tax=Kribbella sp. NPDC006257 TaxID=3156738 RepID=UPI0033B746DD